MKIRSLLGASLLGASLIGLSGAGASAATQCNAGTVSFSLGASGQDALACIGSFSGNDTGAQGTLLSELNSIDFTSSEWDIFSIDESTISGWEILAKSDDAGSGLISNNGGTAGAWSFNNTDGDIDGPFVLSLKASNSWSAYFFDNYQQATAALVGTFETDGVSTNNRGRAQGLSHATIARAIFTPKDSGPASQEIPEPGAVAALGLFALGTVRTLKKRTLQ
ncbi:hypothetical protein [Almyronema epifaneia]|uniref:PEP-CTERM sorting domain-containing protein n=1 Tax=Almyronema epifaneia S1 TaxID=2991925 RepID=A0ABW6IBI3_9CYAN